MIKRGALHGKRLFSRDERPFFRIICFIIWRNDDEPIPDTASPFFQEALFSNAGRDDGNIIAASKKILEVCLDLSVSDVHLEPQKNGLRIRGRMDGVLQDLMRIPPVMQDALISRYKIMARMDIGEKRLPQDGRIQMTYQDRSIDIRVSSLPTLYGETLVMRLLDSGKGLYSLTIWGFQKKTWNGFISFCMNLMD